MTPGLDSRGAGTSRRASAGPGRAALDLAAPAASAEYFDRLYSRHRDPWGLSERFYERRKRDLVFASLPRAHYGRAFEPGCAIGALTAALAQRCDEVVAWDGAQAAVDQTRSFVRKRPGAGRVLVECARIPGAGPLTCST